jgi:hypothetical protein
MNDSRYACKQKMQIVMVDRDQEMHPGDRVDRWHRLDRDQAGAVTDRACL